MPRLPAVLPLAFLAASCTYFGGDRFVVITSTPAGAEVLIDGVATGQTTPTRVELDGMFGDNHEVTLRKPGYAAEQRTVYHTSTGYTSRWIDGATTIVLPSFPLWWTFGDFLTPFARTWLYVPHELHVRLYQEGMAPVHAEDPAATQPAQLGGG